MSLQKCVNATTMGFCVAIAEIMKAISLEC